VLVVVPAHNEARSLPTLIAELRAQSGGLDLLVVDDGSTDGTVALLERLGVRYVRFGERMGVGVAVRAALRLAARDGYDAVVRVDGDGQHPPADLMTLVAALEARHCDLVVGSRTATAGVGHAWWRVTARAAVSWLFSAVALQRVTDPTSGFVAFGPRAIALLGEHHPGGYGEPELRLFARANGLRVVEVPVTMRPRTAGRSTLTLARLAVAGARLLLAVVMVPLRRTVAGRLS
jgi:glycosyltransferase involved in cell wall biosynthesis